MITALLISNLITFAIGVFIGGKFLYNLYKQQVQENDKLKQVLIPVKSDKKQIDNLNKFYLDKNQNTISANPEILPYQIPDIYPPVFSPPFTHSHQINNTDTTQNNTNNTTTPPDNIIYLQDYL